MMEARNRFARRESTSSLGSLHNLRALHAYRYDRSRSLFDRWKSRETAITLARNSYKLHVRVVYIVHVLVFEYICTGTLVLE